jgi:predicted Co/Zn/Cd cation transporter (cation efflux family)
MKTDEPPATTTSSAEPDHTSIEKRSLAVGMWANLLMGVGGVTAAYASHSDALLVDGLYSGVNFIAAIIATRICSTILRPADRRYPFGYDAYESLYVKYRSLVLLGIMTFAAFSASAKIILYATGGEVPKLVFGPILIYMVLMIAICFGLAFWHHTNWKRSGSRSELLKTERQAAIVDGVISAGAGGGLLGAALLRGTMFEFIVPVSDSIVVLVMCAFVIGDPVRMFLRSLREVAGESAEPDVLQQVLSRTQELLQDRPFTVLEVAVTKLGRSYFVVPYLEPQNSVSPEEIDVLRHELESVYTSLIGESKTEIIITAEHPYRDN